MLGEIYVCISFVNQNLTVLQNKFIVVFAAQNKFGIPGTIYLQDGTEIDDEDGFEAVCKSSASPVFVLVPLGENSTRVSS